MQISGEDILQLIPQRAPVVMIDTLVACDEDGSETRFLIKEDNIFCKNGCLSEGGIIENIAQTAASQIGYLYQKANIPVPIGFIGAVKNLEVFTFPKAGTEVSTMIKIENEVLGVTLITGKVFYKDELMASAEMKIVIKK